MTPAPICILYTQDAELVRRTRAFLRSMSQLRHVNDPDRLESVLQQTGPSVLMMDLRSKECRELIDQIQNEQPEVLIIAFGVGQSETLREAEQFGIYVAEEIGLERRRFQALLGRAFDYVKLSQENRDLRETSAMMPEISRKGEATQQPIDIHRRFQWLRFRQAFLRLANLNLFLITFV